MRENVEQFEEASHAMGTESYFAQQDLAALREVGAFAGRLTREQNELCDEASRRIRLNGDAEIERLRTERGGLPWD